ncbi:MAG: hypothetical protein ABGW95_00675, partial [Candidatus Poseidoniia archaeon]
MQASWLRRLGRLARVAILAFAFAFGFAAAAASQDDLDDILGGFEDEDPSFEVEAPSRDDPTAAPSWWDLSGSLELSASVNYLHHR